MRDGLWKTKKSDPKISKKGSGRCTRMVRNGAQPLFPGEKMRDGVQIDKMPFWALRNSLSAGKNMYHEENLCPDSILKSRSRLLL